MPQTVSRIEQKAHAFLSVYNQGQEFTETPSSPTTKLRLLHYRYSKECTSTRRSRQQRRTRLDRIHMLTGSFNQLHAKPEVGRVVLLGIIRSYITNHKQKWMFGAPAINHVRTMHSAH